MYGVLGVLVMYMVIKFIVPKLIGTGCSSPKTWVTSRLSSATAADPRAVKSGEELKQILSGLHAGESAVVMFHAPWCGHCKATMPAYTSAAKNNTCKTKYILADCHNDLTPDAVREYGVQGFPTIKKFTQQGSATEHKGGRSEQAISQFACETP
tara:strand:- start:2815 stop:3276 length:462 start_codon:yes stop_codon:yes gene_type:complete